jgi:hypothetical protein
VRTCVVGLEVVVVPYQAPCTFAGVAALVHFAELRRMDCDTCRLGLQGNTLLRRFAIRHGVMIDYLKRDCYTLLLLLARWCLQQLPFPGRLMESPAVPVEYDTVRNVSHRSGDVQLGLHLQPPHSWPKLPPQLHLAHELQEHKAYHRFLATRYQQLQHVPGMDIFPLKKVVYIHPLQRLELARHLRLSPLLLNHGRLATVDVAVMLKLKCQILNYKRNTCLQLPHNTYAWFER